MRSARESIVKDIAAIGNALDKELADAFKAGDSDITKGFKSQLEEQARKYQNRLTEAALSGGSLGVAKEAITIAKEQLAQLDDIASNEELINRLGRCGAATPTARPPYADSERRTEHRPGAGPHSARGSTADGANSQQIIRHDRGLFCNVRCTGRRG